MTVKSLLRYPGGKTRAIKYLDPFVPNGTKELCSPFFGGGSFEFHLISKGIKYSDWGETAVAGWKQIFFYDPDGNIIEVHEKEVS